MGDRNNRDGRHMTDAERARQQAYNEYLSLRENQNGRQKKYNQSRDIKDDTLYGEYVAHGHRNSAPKNERMHRANAAHETVDRPVKEHKGKPIAKAGSKNKADKPTKAEKKAAKGKHGGKKGGKKLRVAVMVVALIVVLLGGVIAAGLAVVKSTLDNVGKVELDTDTIGIDPQVDKDLSNYRNIALLGIDARNMNDDAGSRSDSMIVVSINKETNEIKMFSVYRDTMLDLGDGTRGLDKVTHAYYYGGPTKALYALNHNMDLNIKEVVVVNWKAVADAVDALGGLEIEIQQSEIQQMNKYIINTQKHIGGSKKLIEAPGKQTLNGVQAVTYARIRKDAATGDYRRNERMKIVVKAAFDKAKTMDYKTLKKITKEVLPEIKTNMSSADMMGMILKVNTYDMTSSTVGWPYKVSGWTGDAWYGPPVTLSSNVTQLHEEFFDQKNYTPTQHVQDISARISAKTGLY